MDEPHEKYTAVELARIAVALDPELAKREPREAVRIARLLLTVAQKEIDRPARQARLKELLQERTQREVNKLFSGPSVSLEEAFESWPGKYKTLKGFRRALQKERLTMWESGDRAGKWIKYSREATSKEAVDELHQRSNARKKARDRERKKLSNQKITRNLDGEKRIAETKKRKATS
jgi:hypothetical protein